MDKERYEGLFLIKKETPGFASKPYLRGTSLYEKTKA